MAGEVTFTKRTAEDKRYDFDFATVTGNDALVLTGTPTMTITPQGKVTETTPLSETGATTNGGVAQFQISGGTDGELYQLVVEATDAIPFRIVKTYPDIFGIIDEDPCAKHTLHVDWRALRGSRDRVRYLLITDHPRQTRVFGTVRPSG